MATKAKKVLSCLVVCLLMLSAIPVSVFALNTSINAPEAASNETLFDIGNPISNIREAMDNAEDTYNSSNKSTTAATTTSTKVAVYSDDKSISDTSKTEYGLSYYADALRAHGYTVTQIYDPITSSKLDGYDVLLMIGLTEYLSSSEKDAIEDFVENKERGLLLSGGTPSVANDLAQKFDGGSIAWFGNYVICDPTDYEVYPKWVKITSFYEHPITENVGRIIMYKGTNVPAAWYYGGISSCAYSDDDSWLDEDGDWVYDSGESRGTQPVLATSVFDKIVIVPDGNVFDNLDADEDGVVAFDEYDNRVLGLNIVEWLAGGGGSQEVRFKGTVTNILMPISAPTVYTIQIDDVISDPTGSMNEGDTAKVSYSSGSSAQVDSVDVGDKVEVHGTYTGYESGEHTIALEGSEDSLSKAVTGAEIQLTTDPYDQWFAAVSGDRIVWVDKRSIYDSDIYMYDISTGTETRITTDRSDQTHPDISGDRIVWGDARNGYGEIYVYDVSTGAETRITTDGSNGAPALSGDRIVWTHYEYHGCDVYMYDLSTGTKTQITTGSSATEPAISGDRIVWEDTRNGNNEIYMHDISTGTETQITTDASASHRRPDISGDRIVWDVNYDGNCDIYMYEVSTGTETQITTTGVSYFVAISGDRIVWESNYAGNRGIYMYDISKGTETRITTDVAMPDFPDVSGDYIVWHDNRNYNRDIYMYIVDDDTSPAPSPEIIDVSYPSTYPSTCINEGKEVTISVTVRNNGDPSSEGYISVSFPNDEVISSVSGTGNGYNDLIPIGSDISCATGTMISVDPLVELQDFDWGAGEAHTLTMQVTPKSGYPGICFYVRAALKNDAEGTYERTPPSGPLDQQGWHIDLHSISAEYAWCTVLSPRSEYTGDDTYVWVITSYPSPDPEDIQVQILYDGDNLIFDSREKTIRLEPDQWGVVEFRVETLYSTKTDQFDVFIPDLCLREPVSLNVTSYTVGDYLQAKLGSRVANVFLRSYPDEEIVNFAEGVLADYSLSRSSADELKAMALLHYVYNHSEFREGRGFIADPHDLIREINDNGHFYGVCRDYTSLYNALATATGLEVRPVTGIFENGKGHAWSEVMIDGEWILVDSTSGFYKDSILCACKWNGDSCGPNAAMELWSDDEHTINGLPDFVKFSFGVFWPSDDHKKVYEHYPPKGGILFAATIVTDPKTGGAMHPEVTSDYSYNTLPPTNALTVGGFSPVEISIYDSNGELIATAEDYYMSWEDLEGHVAHDEEPIGKIAVALDIDPSEEYNVEITGTDEGAADIKALVETTDYTINIDYDDISVSSDFEATFSPTVGDYNLKIDYDGDGIIDETKEPDSIEIVGQTTYSIPLLTGWNLISLPIMPDDSNVLDVLSSVNGNWNSVWSYEAGNWKRYDLTGPDFLNDLITLEPGKGYWMNMKSEDTLSVSGSEPMDKSIFLSTGWNLVGYNSLSSKSTTNAMNSVAGNWNSVWSYENGNWKRYDLTGPDFLNDLTTMGSGKGYWINMKSSDTWTLGE